MLLNNEKGGAGAIIFAMVPLLIITVYVRMTANVTIAPKAAQLDHEQFLAVKLFLNGANTTNLLDQRELAKQAENGAGTCATEFPGVWTDAIVDGKRFCVTDPNTNLIEYCYNNYCMSMTPKDDSFHLVVTDNRNLFQKSKDYFVKKVWPKIPYFKPQIAFAIKTKEDFMPPDPSGLGITHNVTVTPSNANCAYVYQGSLATAQHFQNFDRRQLCRQCYTDAQINNAEAGNLPSLECVEVKVCAKQWRTAAIDGGCAAGEFFTQNIGLYFRNAP